MNSWLIKNARDLQGKFVELAISNGIVVKQSDLVQPYAELDAQGLTLMPGLVDLHTHLREPGREDAETVLTASQSAVAGG